MDKFDLYEDLELEHEKEKKESIDDLRWKEKYTVALNTIEKLQAEKKELNRKIKQLEINFASLLETARTEIKRKDTQICELRKQKDDICFRRFKPKVAELQSHEHSNDSRAIVSGEKVKANPFSCERKPVDQKNNESIVSHEKPPAKERLENGKHHYEKSKYRDQDSRSAADEKVGNSRKRSRDRSNDRNRDRDRSRNRNEYRSRHRSSDRRDHKHRDRFDSRKRERSKERHSRKDDRKEDQHSRRHERNNSGSRSSEGSLQKSNKKCYNTHPNSQETSRKEANEITPKETRGSAKEHDIHRTKDPKIEDCATKSDPLVTKKPDQKIEILQIEILKDVKELKKSKLEAEKLPKPPPCDPMKVQTQKSNQFLDALFDDPLMNPAAESNSDLYDDLEKDQNIDSEPAERRENNSLKMDENCNLNFETPKRQPVSMDDLFGPSPVGSLCSVIGKSHNAAGSPNDVDFVAIEEPQKEKRALDSATIDLSNDCHDENPPSSFKNGTKLCTNENQSRTDPNFKCQLQTPQKQVMAKVYDDLFGPSPANSNCGQTILIDKPSNDSYFEPIASSVNGGKEERTQAPILIDNSSSEESTESERQDKDEYKNRPAEDAKSFKFVELDSSFYSSEDEANDAAGKNQIRTTPRVDEVEELSASQVVEKNTRNLQTKEIAIAESIEEKLSYAEISSDITSKSAELISKTQTEKENHHKSSPEEDQNQLQISSNSSSSHHRSDRHSKNESRKHSPKNHGTSHHKASATSESDEKHSSRHRHTKEKHHNKRDSLSSHPASQSPRRHSKSHHRHKAKRNRNDSFKERTSSLQSEDDRLKEKPAEQDQVFFLHCEELSDDDEILDSSVSIEVQEHDLVQNDTPNVEEDTNQEANVTDHQPTHLIPNQILQNEFVERVEDERIHSDEKDLEPQPSAENEVEEECIVASEPEKCKNEETLESSQDDQGQEVIESNTTITNASGKPSEEAEPELGSREISPNNNLENQLAGPKNEVANPVEQNVFRGKQNEVEDLVNSKEHEIFETQQPGPEENGPLASEYLNSNENSQQEQRVDTETVAISTRKEEESIAKSPSNLHKELNEEPIPIMPEKELSDHIKGHLLLTDDEGKTACSSKPCEDNQGENDYVLIVPENNKPFSEEKLATEVSSKSSSEPHLTETEATHEHFQGHIEQRQESKPPSEKLEEPNASSSIETIVKTQSDTEPAKIESTIQSPLLSNALISSPLKISRNSVDDNENSAHSSTESTTSGRRRKIKTPRKRTDDFIKTTNPTIDVKFDSKSKIDESPNGMQSEMNSKQSNSLSVVLENDKEVEERIKPGEQSITDYNRYSSETETHTKTSIRDLDSIGKDEGTRKEESNFGDGDESGIPQCQENAGDNNNSSQLQDNSMQKKEEGELSTIDEPIQMSPRSEEKPAILNKVKLTENKANKDAQENENTNVSGNLVDQGVILSHTESDKTEIDQTKQIDSNTPQGEASSCVNDSTNKIVEFKPNDIQKIVETFSISITRKRIKKKPTKNAIEPVSVISNEADVNNPKEECLKETNDQEVKIKPPPHIYDDEPCCSSSLNVRLLNGTKYSAKKAKQKSRQPQMMKHFMDSEHILVGECNYQSVSFSEQTVDTNSNEIKPNNRKHKSKADSSLNTTQSSSPDKPKRKYKRKIPQFLESSLSNDDIGHRRIDENVENMSLKEPPKEKRKYTKRKPKQSEWLEEPTSSLSKLDLNDQRDSDKFSESVQTSICSQPGPERLADIISDTREHTEPLESQKEIGQSSPKVKSNNHPKRQRKRKLSDGESKNVPIVSESKKSKTRDEEISPVACDTQSCGSSNAGPDHPHKSPNPRNKSTGVEKSTASVELTPTHHKIFLNDVFPNDPPPVYRANDDDHQYHEIDDRLRCMFQSPSYTQSSNGEYSLDKTNDDHVDVTCDSQNFTINETILSQSEPTKLSDLSSSSTKKLSLGSNEYVIESIGSHAANVFITRKKCKKRTRVVAGAM